MSDNLREEIEREAGRALALGELDVQFVVEFVLEHRAQEADRFAASASGPVAKFRACELRAMCGNNRIKSKR